MGPSGPARRWRRTSAVLRVATRRWLAPRTSLFAAALAFFALLSLAPTLLVVVSVAARLLGEDSARLSLAEAATRFAGPGADQVASRLLSLLPSSRWQTAGTLLGLALLLTFSSSFVAQLRAALNTVWEVPARGIGRALLDRVVSLGQTLVATIGLLVVLAWGMLRSIVRPLLAQTENLAMAWAVWTRLGTLLMTLAVLYAAFRYIPGVRPRPGRRAVVAGSLAAALTLNLTSEVFAYVIARSSIASLYGAAGSLIMFLLWMYYSGFLVLFGAEICRAWDEVLPRRTG